MATPAPTVEACPHCHLVIPKGAAVCPHCEVMLVAVTPGVGPAFEACPHCHLV